MQNLKAHITKFIDLDGNQADLLDSFFTAEPVRKKQHLLEAGQPASKLFFVSKGLLRLYVITSKGTEQTHQFVIENWWLSDYLAFHNNEVSVFYIQAVENSEVIAIEKRDLEKLLLEIPNLERYFRLCYEKSVGAAQRRIQYLFSMSAEERYRNMSSQFPDFVQRVPQYMLASYLDFSAEFLSKIRAGKI